VTATQSKESVHRRDHGVDVFEVGVTSAIVAGLLGPRALLAAVVVCVAVATVVDLETARIPNACVLAVLAATMARAVGAVIVGDHTMVAVARDLVMGVTVSGGLALFVVWLIRPHVIGGGDWKMLAAVGGAVGLVDVTAAAIVGVVAVAAQLVAGVIVRRRVLPFGPALLGGTVASALSTTWLHFGAGGWS
jgi:leader peptidase (prepilin peptidase)/N-methyltransferase